MNLEKLLPYLPSITTLIATTYAIYALNFELNKKNEPNQNSNSNLNEDKNSEEQNTSNKEKKKEEHGKIAPIFKNDSRKYLTNKGVLAVLLLLLSCAIS